ncbi:MAG: 1-acyl-sn-glycerol-3-phosphate acyltransferase [Bdellovibrionia bacterium]
MIDSNPTPLQPPGKITGSHPAIRFKQVPIIPGSLFDLEKKRARILSEVVQKTKEDLSQESLENLLGEALFSEKARLKRQSLNWYTRSRYQKDQKLWGEVHQGFLKPSGEVDRETLLHEVISHYAEEIGGHFDPRIYPFATRAVPWLFSWLLNAASVQRFLPWGMTESLSSRLHIVGEIPALQNLASRGTILLVPTHQSNIDSVLIGYVIYLMSLTPFAYGAGLNLFSNPILGFFMSRLGSYTVDRQKKNEIYKNTLKNYSTRILKEGIHCIFFPGGGRSRSGAIENRVKLGLLGTGLEAQIDLLKSGSQKKVFVVPMVISNHFVLEAGSLIEEYLAELGKHRYIFGKEDAWQIKKVVGFFWNFFSSHNAVTVRIGRALDVFGNFVDSEGRSLGPNGTFIDPARWLTTAGELKADPMRDQEYTRELGERLTERFHRENTVLSSHLVAFSFFETLRRKYPDFDLFRFLRLSLEQRSILFSQFLGSAEGFHKRVLELEAKGALYVSPELKTLSTEAWVKDGIRSLGYLHDAAVVKLKDDVIFTENMNLLYYYRNRLTGYGLSLLAQRFDSSNFLRQNDAQGFLV